MTPQTDYGQYQCPKCGKYTVYSRQKYVRIISGLIQYGTDKWHFRCIKRGCGWHGEGRPK